MSNAIELEHVSKRLDDRPVLDDVTLVVERGDIFGYLGPNGAGKTTTIRILLGLLESSGGVVRVLGRHPREDAVRARMGFLLDADGLYDGLSATANLTFYGELYGVPGLAGLIGPALERAGLAERAGDKVATFSKGMRQRLGLARALLHSPEVLILDEPTAGLDPAGQVAIREILVDLAHNSGATVFLSSHNLDEVQRICNRVALIEAGKIRLQGELRELERQKGAAEVTIETRTPIAEDVLAAVREKTGAELRSQMNGAAVLTLRDRGDVPAIVTILAAGGAQIESVRRQEASLEDLYLRIVEEAGEEEEDSAAADDPLEGLDE